MTTPRRKCRLADTNHADIDLRDYEENKLVFVTGDSPFERCGKLYSGCSQARLNDNFTTSMFRILVGLMVGFSESTPALSRLSILRQVSMYPS